MAKKQNFIIRFFKCIGRGIKNFFLFLSFCLTYILVFPFTRCKIYGREKIKKEDEAQVFITNHYQLYGPLVTFMNLPFKFRPWIIDNMMESDKVEHQMGLMVYNEYKKVPKFFKWIVIKVMKNLMVYSMRKAGGISVSRENSRANVKAMQISSETLSAKTPILIFPEKDYVNEGVGVFMYGFEHIAKYHYQKTEKKVTFYPIFISKINKSMFILDPITFNPDNDKIEEKMRIVEYLRNSMVEKYEEVEVNNPKVQEKIKKKNNKELKKKNKKIAKNTTKDMVTDVSETINETTADVSETINETTADAEKKQNKSEE